MPRFYFHLSAPDEALPDTIGCEIDDLATAHARAVKLAERIIMLARSAESIADLRPWTVKVADENQRVGLTVIFPAHERPPVEQGSSARMPINDLFNKLTTDLCWQNQRKYSRKPSAF
jgi:hypothetical protein